MECTVYNLQKVRLETLEVEFTEENTTRFYNRGNGSKLAVDVDRLRALTQHRRPA